MTTEIEAAITKEFDPGRAPERVIFKSDESSVTAISACICNQGRGSRGNGITTEHPESDISSRHPDTVAAVVDDHRLLGGRGLLEQGYAGLPGRVGAFVGDVRVPGRAVVGKK